MLARMFFCMWWKIYNDFLGSMKDACKHRPWKQCFFSRVVLPNSNYWSQGFEIKTGFHSSMYLEISQRCGYSLDNFWTWTEINGSNLKAVTFMNKKLSPFMVGRPISWFQVSRLCMNFTFIYICCHFIHRSTGMALRLWVAEWMDLGPVFHEEHVSIRITSFRFSLLAIFHFILWTDFFESSELCTHPSPKNHVEVLDVLGR